MKLARFPAVFFGIVCSLAAVDAQVEASARTQEATAAPDFSSDRALLEEARAALQTSDYATARAKAADAAASLLTWPGPDDDERWLDLLDRAGHMAWEAQDPRTAKLAWERVYEVRSQVLPDDHPDLQAARQNLALTLKVQGDLASARTLEEQALAALERTRPEDDYQLQAARLNLASTRFKLGDVAAARDLFAQVLEVFSRTLPPDHRTLQAARLSLAVAQKALGDLQAAQALEQQVLEVYERTLPEDHPDLLLVRQNLGATLRALGDLGSARDLFEQVLEARSRNLPDEHPDLQLARGNLAVVLKAVGDVQGARRLEEDVLAVRSRTSPQDHPDLQMARQNLALTLKTLGYAGEARELEERVLDVRLRTLPQDHPDLQAARMNLAATLLQLGDVAAARELFEVALEVLSRSLPDEHPDLQKARLNLAIALQTAGELSAARELMEKVVEVFSRTLPADHPDLAMARRDLAVNLQQSGDLPRARRLQEELLATLSRTLPDEHPEIGVARVNLAATLGAQGDMARARELLEDALDGLAGCLPEDDPALRLARRNLSFALASLGEREECSSRCREVAHSLCQGVRSWASVLAPRELEARVEAASLDVSAVLSLAAGAGVVEPDPSLELEAFALVESLRGAGLLGARLAGTATRDVEVDACREEMREASFDLARLVQGDADREALNGARRRLEDDQRELAERLSAMPEGRRILVQPDFSNLLAAVGESEALVSYWCYTRATLDPDDSSRQETRESLVAFVARRGSELAAFDLGPIDAVEAAVLGWRRWIGLPPNGRGLGVVAAGDPSESESGEILRRLVLDPLLPRLEGAEQIVVAVDDVLHIVPLDALPLGDGLVGDRMRIHLRSTLWELLLEETPPMGGALVAVGGIDYGSSSQNEGSTRALAGTSFGLLPATAVETSAIAALWKDLEIGDTVLLTQTNGSRSNLIDSAPRARFLHIATHGWFAPESVRSAADPQRLDRWTGLGPSMSREQQLRGSSPMVLCGLALSGANQPEDAFGHVSGVITAEEIAALDLSGCELAVLSACDTSVGHIRCAGQGVASLQRALHMAGAHSVITSLWKVPDEATKDLMLDFYRRMWVEKKPKWQALWEAKMSLRNAKNERGEPLYSTRDWAAWVLTGEPD